jgi:tetratricopeptide (TPR) repeat protein
LSGASRQRRPCRRLVGLAQHLMIVGKAAILRAAMRALAASSVRVVLIAMIGFSAARAEEPRPEEKVLKEAREHAHLGDKYYNLGRWDEAIAEFEKAYDLRNDPAFLFNLAQACRRRGDYRRAIDLYTNFLQHDPNSPLRPKVEERIRVLRKELKNAPPVVPGPKALGTPPAPSQTTSEPAAVPLPPVAPAPVPGPAPEAPSMQVAPPPATVGSAPPLPAAVWGAPPPPAAIGNVPPPPAAGWVPFPPPAQPPQAMPVPVVPAPTPQPASVAPAGLASLETSAQPSQSGRGLRMAAYACAGVGVLSAGAGIYYYTRARSMSDRVSTASTWHPDDAEAGRNAETMQWVFYGIGAGAVAAGVLLYYLGSRTPAPGAAALAVAPLLGQDVAGAVARGSF